MYYIYLAQIDNNTIKIGMTSLQLCQRQAVLRTQEGTQASILIGWRFNNIDKSMALLLESAVRYALAHSNYKSLRFTGQLDHFHNNRHIAISNLQGIMDKVLMAYTTMYQLDKPITIYTKAYRCRL